MNWNLGVGATDSPLDSARATLRYLTRKLHGDKRNKSHLRTLPTDMVPRSPLQGSPQGSPDPPRSSCFLPILPISIPFGIKRRFHPCAGISGLQRRPCLYTLLIQGELCRVFSETLGAGKGGLWMTPKAPEILNLHLEFQDWPWFVPQICLAILGCDGGV